MTSALKSLGILFWASCLLTLLYQSATWIVTASWPSLSLMGVSTELMGLDVASAIASLPLDMAVKTAYILFTTELAVALWWAGLLCFAATMTIKILFHRK